MKSLICNLQQNGISTVENCSLRQHSTFRIGGEARVALFPKTREELLLSLEAVTDARIPMLVIGKGSNVVFSDEGYDGAVIFTGAYREIHKNETRLHVSAGVPLSILATYAAENALGGLEFAYGIPGTLGGAVFMNAGAFEGCMSQICVASEYFDLESKAVKRLSGERQEFGSRTSFYQAHPEAVILGAELELVPASQEAIKQTMEGFAARRKAMQPLEYPSAGSVFKRPVGHYAGKLIEDCGLKGYAVGGAEVSEKHAGFIINRGNATAKDVKELTKEIKERVAERFGVVLECEIRFL